MHRCIAQMRDKPDLIQEAKRGYIVALTGSVETFYHDLVIHLLSQDSALLQKALAGVKEKFQLGDIHGLLAENISFPEMVAAHMNFQSLEEIERVLENVFPPGGYLDALSSFEFICAIPARSAGVAKVRLPSKWRGEFAELFKIRHGLVHDANLPCDVTHSKMANLEALVLQIAQMTAGLVSKLFQVAPPSGTLPAFMLIEDLIAEDWEILADCP